MSRSSLFQTRAKVPRPANAIRVILHGGPLKGREAYVTSQAEPIPERGGAPGFVIEIAVDDLDGIDSAHLSRIDRAWLHHHSDYRMIRRLPDFLWDLPALKSVFLSDSRLNDQLFQRGMPDGVEHLKLYGSGRWTPAGRPNPSILFLDTLLREFHPRLSPKMFPCLEGLTVHVGRKADRKDRREMWEVIRSFEGLKALHVEPADAALDWGALPGGLRRMKLGNGDLDDLSRLHVFDRLEFLHLHYLRSLRTLDGIEAFDALRAVVLIGMERVEDYGALLRMPKLEFVHASGQLDPELFKELEKRGVRIRG